LKQKQVFVSFGRAALASAVMIWLAAPAQATVVATYSNRTTWSTSLTTVSTVDFNETMASGGDTFQSYSNSTGYTDPNNLLNFLGKLGTGPITYELFRTTVGGARLLRGPDFTSLGQSPRVEVNVLASAARGFGVTISSSVAGLQYEFVVDGEVLSPNVTSSGSTPVFFGVRTDANISQIVIRVVGGAAFGDSSYFEDAAIGFGSGEPPPSEAPEPSTIVLTTGALVLAWIRRRRAASH
jgi:hypothetical protein